MSYSKRINDENEIKKLELFKKDIQNYDSFNEKIRNMYQAELDEVFQEILIISKEDFISFITNGVKNLLSDMYSEQIFNDETLKEIKENCENDINKEYNSHFEKLIQSWKNYERENKRNNITQKNYLTHFRKHCSKTDNFAYHNCQHSQNKFYIVEENNIQKYVICIDCQKVFLSNMILCHCINCNVDYYSNILKKEEDNNILLATWEKYHCNIVVNEKMKCLKCKNDLYLNLKKNLLICLNPKCNFTSLPEKIIWSCNICGSDFKSNAIVFNPLQNEYIKRIIKQTLFIKHKAHPNKLPCCKLNIFFTDFYHKKDCKGILYIGELNHKIIIVCEKCKAFNFYDRFIWTCPRCGIRFRDKKNMRVLKSESDFNNIINKSNVVNNNRNKQKSLFDVLMERKKKMKEEMEKVRKEEEMENKIKENENKINIDNNNNINGNDNNNNEENYEEEIEENEEEEKKEININNNKENRNQIFDKLNKKEKKEINDKNIIKEEDNSKNKKKKKKKPKKKDTTSSNEDSEEVEILSPEKNQNIINLAPDPIQQQNIKQKINEILIKSKIPKFNIEEFTLYGQLGEGSYGIIYQAINNKTKKKYALKKIIAKDLDEIKSFENEYKLVYECQHKNIMKIYGICICNLDAITFALYVLMEIALYDWDEEIKNRVNQRKNYKEEELINILKQLVSALLFMEQKLRIAHRDIKPQNILVFKNKLYKIADFGEAKEVKISKQLNTLRGTELYMSPILYNGLKKDKDDVTHNPYKSDVFSVGFCFMYAATLNFNIIYEVRDLVDMEKVEKILHRYLKNKYTEKFFKVLLLMMETDENKRVDFCKLNKYIIENFSEDNDEEFEEEENESYEDEKENDNRQNNINGKNYKLK